jgi:CRP-like cAMP-binding protein
MDPVAPSGIFDTIVRSHRAALGGCPLFDGIPEPQLAGLFSCLGAAVRKYDRGGIPLVEGQKLNTIGIVLSGEVEVAHEDAAGNRHIIGRIGPSELFGETFACAGESKSPVTVTAVVPSEVLDVDFGRLVRPCGIVCPRHQSLITNMLRILAEKNVRLTRKMDVLTRKTIRGRLAAYLLSEMQRAGYLEFEIPFDRNGLAEYLSCDRSALSRELGHMKDEGIIDFRKNLFAVLDAASLAGEMDR